MNVTATVSDNLFIVGDTLTSTAKKADNTFGTALQQDVSALLEPVSTIDGLNYFYSKTNNVIGNGNVKDLEWTAYNAGDTSAFNTNYSTTDAKGYVDYVFQLKAINASDTDTAIYLTGLNLTYGGVADESKAYRVAVFAEDITAGTATAAPTNLKAIYTVTGAANFDPGKAVNSTTARAAVTYNAALALPVKVNTASGYTNGTYYKVVVRMWLEGDDTTCNNTTFAKLKDGWALDLTWNLKDATNTESVLALTAATTATKVDLGSATLASTTRTINSDIYTQIATVQLGGEDLYVLGTTLTKDSRIFTIDSNGYMTEVTNQCTLPTV